MNPSLARVVERMDRLIADLENAGEQVGDDLLLEHLEAARIDLLGGMPAEYAMSLNLAFNAAQDLPDASLRAQVLESIDALRRLAAPTP